MAFKKYVIPDIYKSLLSFENLEMSAAWRFLLISHSTFQHLLGVTECNNFPNGY